jgi:hypothetical protein
MKRVLVLSAGGPASLSYCRSLRLANKDVELHGADSDAFNLIRAETDFKLIIPKHTDQCFEDFIIKYVSANSIDFLHPQSEADVYKIGLMREKLKEHGCKTFLPSQREIELFRDKGKSYRLWSDAGITVPKNIFIDDVEDLTKAFEFFGKDIWLRETIGAAGKGSLSRPTFEEAFSLIEMNKSWGRVVAATHLTSDTVTLQSVWYEGELFASQGRRRLNWAFGNRSQSGVTGLTGVGKIFNSSSLSELAQKCIKAANDMPHGIYSVDFTYDNEGIPNPTEINIGKFFTTHMFLSKVGANMPAQVLDLVFGETKPPKLIDLCPDNMFWVRGIDVEPKLVNATEIDALLKTFFDSKAQI